MIRYKRSVRTPAPSAKVIWPVTDSLWRGYLDVGADWPYLLTSMLAQRSESGRGWTASDAPLVPTGTLYAAVDAFGTPHRSNVSPGATLATAITNFASTSASLHLTPTDVILERGLNDIDDGATAAEALALTQTWWGLVRAAFPSARYWQIVPWARAGSSADRIAYIAGLVAGQAGADVSLIDWRSVPDPGLFTKDPSGIHQDLPTNPTTWATWLGPQAYQSDISWCARSVLEALYGTHVGGGWSVTRTLTNLSGEVYP